MIAKVILVVLILGNISQANLIEHIVTEYLATNEVFPKYKEGIKEVLHKLRDPVDPEDFNKCVEGEDPDYYHFLPSFLEAVMKPDSKAQTFKGLCFQQNTVTISGDSNDYYITISASGQKTKGCYDWYMIATISHWHLLMVDSEGDHQVNFMKLSAQDILDIQNRGINVFGFCESVAKAAESLLLTLKLFVGGFINLPVIHYRVPSEMEQANVEFLEEATGYKMEQRFVTTVHVNETE